MIETVRVNDLDKYYKIIREMIENSSMWRSLSRKYDHGCSKNEMYYQEMAMSEAGDLAETLGYNRHLTEILSMCRGAFFPMGGSAGIEEVEEYLNEVKMDLPLGDLAVEFVETEIVRNGGVIAPELDEAVRALFHGKESSPYPEVDVVKMCAKTVRDVKNVERHMGKDTKSLLEQSFEDMKQCTQEANALSYSAKLTELLNFLPNEAIKPPMEHTSRTRSNRIRSLVKENNYDTKQALFAYLKDIDDWKKGVNEID